MNSFCCVFDRGLTKVQVRIWQVLTVNGHFLPRGRLHPPVLAFQMSVDILHRRLSIPFLLPLSLTPLPQVDSKALLWPKRACLPQMGIWRECPTALPLQDGLITSIRAWQVLLCPNSAHQLNSVQTIFRFRPCLWEKPVKTVGWLLLAQRLTAFTFKWALRPRKTLWLHHPARPCLQPHLHPNPWSTTALAVLTAPGSMGKAWRTRKVQLRWTLP